MGRSKKLAVVLVIALVIVPLVLSACGGDDKKDDKQSGSGTVELKQSFTGANGISVKYPDGWVAEDIDGGMLYLANSQSTMDAMKASSGEGAAAGQYGVMFLGLSADQLAGMSVEDAFKMMAQSMAGESENTTVSDVTQVKVNGKDAYRVDITSTDGEGFILGWDEGGALVVAVGVSAPGEMKDREASLLAVAGSVTYTAPAATAG